MPDKILLKQRLDQVLPISSQTGFIKIRNNLLRRKEAKPKVKQVCSSNVYK